MEQIKINDTIAAIATPVGKGGIAVIRISGKDALGIVNSAWRGADLTKAASHTAHLGKYIAKDGKVLDEAVSTIFISPASFTGEDVVEISAHGSTWIQKEILQDLVVRGARIAEPGEFTKRAFLNGKLDLAQAEGVADLIAASSKAAHDLAMNQTKGAFSRQFELLREKLIEFASLLELELDFSEEDVEFAARDQLLKLCDDILLKVKELTSSYAKGNAIKNGVPVVIAGLPNAGKSSLLNLLVDDEKAIVTDIPGTTRDLIEDTIEIEGILYRFIDTAGIRETFDKVEGIGVERALQAIKRAFIVIWVIDLTSELTPQLQNLQKNIELFPDKNFIVLANKSDLNPSALKSEYLLDIVGTSQQNHKIEFDIENTNCSNDYKSAVTVIPFSNATKQGYTELMAQLRNIVTSGKNPESDVILTNARHFEVLSKASEALSRARDNISANISGDFIAQDIREAISYLSTLTGSITTTTLLHSIFSRFCIGK